MKLKISVVGQIAKMICGDNYEDIFPYRSSSYLTDFFRSIDLDYVHQGQSRLRWVQSILDNLNENGTFPYPDLPSLEMIKVIEQLIHPSEFQGHRTNIEKARELLSDLLKTEGLLIQFNETTGAPTLKNMIGEYVSTALPREKADKFITFSPEVFRIPDKSIEPDLVAVMMPFSKEFYEVYATIKGACLSLGLKYKRADDIWEESTIIQDIFNLIVEAPIVIADLSGKNPNVLYEIGIAHTLGKHVIPISQHLDDIPFDLRHHRTLIYLNNGEGRNKLKDGLESRLKYLKEK
jgi:nucleoside 2-deoxyribosyltransferase